MCGMPDTESIESRASIRTVAVAGLACVALGSLLLPWHHDWLPYSFDNPFFFVVPVPALETWAGWGVATFDGLILVLALACLRQPGAPATPTVRHLQCWLAAGTIVVLCIDGILWCATPRPDLELRMRVLGPPLFGWWWLRWEFGLPVMANVCLLILCRGPRAYDVRRQGE